MKRLFTSESVTEGHPDKICDQISDAILDEILTSDPNARVACETCASTGIVIIMGEITTNANVDVTSMARKVILDIGYDSAEKGLDGNTCAVLSSIHRQSPDIAQGVDRAQDLCETGAGDQGMMFGFACTQTKEKLPLPIALSHRLTRRLAQCRKEGIIPFLLPDGKAQVTVRYDGNHPLWVDTVVVSTQHQDGVPQKSIREAVMDEVIGKVIPAELIKPETKYFINPTGRFVIGGPAGDTGLTGRKIIVDTYGGYAPHGGGAFSGKDPTKVDRSAAYAARHAAKNIVAAGLADICQVELAYAIGVARPVSFHIDTRGTGVLSDEELTEIASRVFDMRPDAIIDRLNLKAPVYFKTASYGHFGRDDLDLSWEREDMTEALRAECKAHRKN